MRKTSFYLFSCAVAILIFFACRKPYNQPSEASIDLIEKFFQIPPATDPLVIALNQHIFRQEHTTPFVKQFIGYAGMPLWDKAKIFGSKRDFRTSGRGGDSSAFIYVPFQKEDSVSIGALLIAKVSGRDTSIKMVYHWQYANYGFQPHSDSSWNAQDVFHMFSLFDRDVLGHNSFRILDNRLVNLQSPPSRPVLLKIKESAIRSLVFAPVTTCEGYDACYDPSGNNFQCPSGGCYEGCVFWLYEQWICTTTWVWGNGPDFGTGGGGTPGWTENPCRSNPEFGTNPCQGPFGWQVVVEDDNDYFNPHVADTVIIDTSISNNFPCVTRIIDSLRRYSNMNALAQVALNTVFGVDKKMHLNFKVNPAWGQNQTDGDTNYDSALIVGIDFYATIRLNPWMLTHSTQEYIAATIIHEAVHAYIGFKYYQYRTGVIDSTTFKTLFPVYWPPKVAGFYNNAYLYQMGESGQHQAMAANLISIMKNALMGLYPNFSIRPSLRDSIYDALAWGGLDETTSYSVRNDSLLIRAMNTMAKDTSTHAPFTLTGSPGTNYTTDSHNSNMKKGCQ